ncbi:hypothetical protein PG984_000210 [Apiospora sp. TS-2023a]
MVDSEVEVEEAYSRRMCEKGKSQDVKDAGDADDDTSETGLGCRYYWLLQMMVRMMVRLDDPGGLLAVTLDVQLEVVQLDFEVAGPLELGQVGNGDVAVVAVESTAPVLLASGRHFLSFWWDS